jgi:hypothetical protein
LTGKSDFVLIIKISEVIIVRYFFEDFCDVFEEGLEGRVGFGVVDVAL